VFSKTVFSIARSTFRMCSVMAIFKSSIVFKIFFACFLYCNHQVHRDVLFALYIFCVNIFPLLASTYILLVFPLQVRQTCRSNGRNVRLCAVYVSCFLVNHFTEVDMTNVGWQVDSKVRYKGDMENPSEIHG
jgi:hypothetical protein